MSNCSSIEVGIKIVEASTFDRKYSTRRGPTAETAVIVPLAGCTDRFILNRKEKDSVPLIDISSVNTAWFAGAPSFVYMDEVANTWRIYISPEISRNLCLNNKNFTGHYNCMIYNQYGEAIFLQYGPAEVQATIV